MTAVLLVDDDVELAEMLAAYLAQDGFQVTTRHDGASGVEAALSGDFAIVVLDVMMPRLSGVEVLRRIRAVSTMPVLMLTAKGDDMDRIVGLELGADDYVPKPCQPRELAARLRAILRRSAATAEPSNAPIVVGELCVRRHAGRPVSKSDLSEQALGRALARFDRSIDVHLSSIRHKLGTLPDGRSCIQTVYRQGYQLIRA